jgi:4-azaleucine resistance transporter AzlC
VITQGESRRRLIRDTLIINASIIAFGFMFGLAARDAGYSPLEAMAMSTFLFAGAAQFAGVGYVAAGLPWAPIIVLTLFLNARHLLYSAALAPRLRELPPLRRAFMAHFLTDEAFALSAAHFQRIGRADEGGYWIAALGGVFIPWNLSTLAGVLLGGAIPDPSRFGLDIVFPAAMGGLAVGLMLGRREIVAACAGALAGVGASLALGPGVGIMIGGLLGPLAGMAMPGPDAGGAGGPGSPESDLAARPVDLDGAISDLATLSESGAA